MEFVFATSGRIIFGCGKVNQAGSLAAEYGRNVLLVTGVKNPDPQQLINSLTEYQIDWHVFRISGEPSVENVKNAVETARSWQCDSVIGFGGGSVIDAGKATAALLTNPGDPLNYLEVVGEGKTLVKPPAPFIAIPTTAGTGSEVTRNAVLTVESKAVKVSLRSHMMLPTAAIVDPELTYSLPPNITASAGMDALAQVLEPFVSVRANPMVDMFCKEGLTRVSRSLEAAYLSGEKGARLDMAWASLLGGMALANSGLGVIHGFAGPLGGMLSAPHGVLCAAMLPIVTEANINILMERQPENPALTRYQMAAQILVGQQSATVQDLVEWLKTLGMKFQVPSLESLGMSRKDIPAVVEKAQNSSSMKGNPIALSREDLTSIMESLL
jgi:alcohol dehydrogenase class IV